LVGFGEDAVGEGAGGEGVDLAAGGGVEFEDGVGEEAGGEDAALVVDLDVAEEGRGVIGFPGAKELEFLVGPGEFVDGVGGSATDEEAVIGEGKAEPGVGEGEGVDEFAGGGAMGADAGAGVSGLEDEEPLTIGGEAGGHGEVAQGDLLAGGAGDPSGDEAIPAAREGAGLDGGLGGEVGGQE
jgi:hypothetical protein